MTANGLLGRHAAAWMADVWYRRACLVGPQALGFAVLVAVLSLRAAPPPSPPASAGWVHPGNDRGRFEAMRTLQLQAKADPAAARLLREKAEGGDAVAQFFMGQSTDPTIDRAAATAERTAEAVRWYREAAERNLPIAQADLGNLLAHGHNGIPPDFAEAFRWLQEAAPRVPMAQRELGMLYRYGRGVPMDPNKAMELIRAAADRNDAVAQVILADALDHGGDGVIADHAEAVRLLQKAAMSNNAFAQRRLAIHLRDGDGVAVDPAQARYWFGRAAANGDSYAKAQIEGAQTEGGHAEGSRNGGSFGEKIKGAGATVPGAAAGKVTPYSFAPVGR